MAGPTTLHGRGIIVNNNSTRYFNNESETMKSVCG